MNILWAKKIIEENQQALLPEALRQLEKACAPWPVGLPAVSKRPLSAILVIAYISFLAHPILAGGKEVRIHNRNYEYEMKVDGNRVLDKNYKTKYRLEGKRIYDENYRYQGKIEGNKIYDRNYRYQGKIEGDKVYDRDYRLKYYLKK